MKDYKVYADKENIPIDDVLLAQMEGRLNEENNQQHHHHGHSHSHRGHSHDHEHDHSSSAEPIQDEKPNKINSDPVEQIKVFKKKYVIIALPMYSCLDKTSNVSFDLHFSNESHKAG